MSQVPGNIFSIQRYCIHDGPGIRTTVFFKGCPLSCFWCHNPESQKSEQEIQVVDFRCIKCGLCIKNCPNDARKIVDDKILILKNKCKLCMKCVSVCMSKATEVVGREYTVDELIKKIITDVPFYKRSRGGVTFSGGEPLIQIEFLLECLKECKKNNIHTALDTSGYGTWSKFEKILNFTDLFLYDIKTLDNKKHKKATGVSNKIILENLNRISERNAKIHIRIPLIPNFNDTSKDMEEIANYLKKIKGIELVELLNFHQLGYGKYKNLQRQYLAENLKPIKDERIKELSEIFIKNKFNIKTR